MKLMGLFVLSIVCCAVNAQDRYIVEFNSDIDFSHEMSTQNVATLDLNRQQAIAALEGLLDRESDEFVLRSYSNLPYLAVYLDSQQVSAFRREKFIKNIWPDKLLRASIEDVAELIGSSQVIDAAFGNNGLGSGSRLAVLDSGIDRDHPAIMSSRITGEFCFTVSGENSMCPNGQATDSGPGASEACLNGAPHKCGHGTSVSSIAMATPNELGPPGISGARIISINVFHKVTNPSVCDPDPTPCTRTYQSSVIAALNQLISMHDAGVRIYAANLSLGGGSYSSSCPGEAGAAAFSSLRAREIAVVAATGNEGLSGGIGWPACHPDVIAVASSTKSDALSHFSNVSSDVDLLAPGSLLNAAMFGGEYGLFSGTSAAAPVVSGSLAILRNITPNVPVSSLVSLLRATGKDITGRGHTLPRIDLLAATEEWRLPYSQGVIEIAREDHPRSYDVTGLKRVFTQTGGICPMCNCSLHYEDLSAGTSKVLYQTSLWSGPCGRSSALLSPNGNVALFVNGPTLQYHHTASDEGESPFDIFELPNGSFRLGEASTNGDMVTLFDGNLWTYTRGDANLEIHNRDHLGNLRQYCANISLAADKSLIAYACSIPSNTDSEIFLKVPGDEEVTYLTGGKEVRLCENASAAAYIDNDDRARYIDLETFEVKVVSPHFYDPTFRVDFTSDCRTVFFNSFPPSWSDERVAGIFSSTYPFLGSPKDLCRTTDGYTQACMATNLLADERNLTSPGGHVINVYVSDAHGVSAPWWTYSSSDGFFEIKYLRNPFPNIFNDNFEHDIRLE